MASTALLSPGGLPGHYSTGASSTGGGTGMMSAGLAELDSFESLILLSIEELLDKFPSPPTNTPSFDPEPVVPASISSSIPGAGAVSGGSSSISLAPATGTPEPASLAVSATAATASPAGGASSPVALPSPGAASSSTGPAATVAGATAAAPIASSAASARAPGPSLSLEVSRSLDVAAPESPSSAAPSGLLSPQPNRDYEDLLRRATKGVIGPKEQQLLYSYIYQLSPTSYNAMQSKVLSDAKNPILRTRNSVLSDIVNRNSGPPLAEVSNYYINFNGITAPIGQAIVEKIFIHNKMGKVKFKFNLPPRDIRYDLEVTPLSGRVKSSGRGPREEIIFKLTCKTTVHIQDIIIMEVEGGPHHLFCLNIQSEPSMFGMAISTIELIPDQIFAEHIFEVPPVLVTLKTLLTQHNGYSAPGIFRLSNEDGDTTTLLRSQINRHKGDPQGIQVEDVYAVANLIKIWFRELPACILSDLPAEALASTDEAACYEALCTRVPNPARSIVFWLLDLICQVALFSSVNGMSLKALANIIGPNLYFTTGSSALPPLESLRLSQQIANFVFALLSKRAKIHS
ncbi:hypothetical protein H696_03665 [Fonticula alba]|uniref:Rho-GAP domain-containing protein n=1 Tax=Fonticula alba TaxID=691883 RepID=A0A058Z7V7_FONAL|nr:hypothetical protein H696_03665 [Fonticula alba]KCV70206.1 hypothetical protein H696_03665 [Fonticula alba]|eukprot:XP_009495812.1 hypothetical protein H696_03665 [Fonticula alba]